MCMNTDGLPNHFGHCESRTARADARHHKETQHHKSRRPGKQPPKRGRAYRIGQSAHPNRGRTAHAGCDDRKTDLMRFGFAIVKKVAGRRLPFTKVDIGQSNKKKRIKNKPNHAIKTNSDDCRYNFS